MAKFTFYYLYFFDHIYLYLVTFNVNYLSIAIFILLNNIYPYPANCLLIMFTLT